MTLILLIATSSLSEETTSTDEDLPVVTLVQFDGVESSFFKELHFELMLVLEGVTITISEPLEFNDASSKKKQIQNTCWYLHDAKPNVVIALYRLEQEAYIRIVACEKNDTLTKDFLIGRQSPSVPEIALIISELLERQQLESTASHTQQEDAPSSLASKGLTNKKENLSEENLSKKTPASAPIVPVKDDELLSSKIPLEKKKLKRQEYEYSKYMGSIVALGSNIDSVFDASVHRGGGVFLGLLFFHHLELRIQLLTTYGHVKSTTFREMGMTRYLIFEPGVFIGEKLKYNRFSLMGQAGVGARGTSIEIVHDYRDKSIVFWDVALFLGIHFEWMLTNRLTIFIGGNLGTNVTNQFESIPMYGEEMFAEVNVSPKYLWRIMLGVSIGMF